MQGHTHRLHDPAIPAPKVQGLTIEERLANLELAQAKETVETLDQPTFDRLVRTLCSALPQDPTFKEHIMTSWHRIILTDEFKQSIIYHLRDDVVATAKASAKTEFDEYLKGENFNKALIEAADLAVTTTDFSSSITTVVRPLVNAQTVAYTKPRWQKTKTGILQQANELFREVEEDIRSSISVQPPSQQYQAQQPASQVAPNKNLAVSRAERLQVAAASDDESPDDQAALSVAQIKAQARRELEKEVKQREAVEAQGRALANRVARYLLNTTGVPHAPAGPRVRRTEPDGKQFLIHPEDVIEFLPACEIWEVEHGYKAARKPNPPQTQAPHPSQYNATPTPSYTDPRYNPQPTTNQYDPNYHHPSGPSYNPATNYNNQYTPNPPYPPPPPQHNMGPAPMYNQHQPQPQPPFPSNPGSWTAHGTR